MAAHAPFNKTDTTIGHKTLQNCYGVKYCSCVPGFLFLPPSSGYAGTQTHPDAALWDAAAAPHRLSADVRLRHQGARGSLAVWRRKRGLAHPLIASRPSAYLPSSASSPAPAGGGSRPCLLMPQGQKQPRLTVWDTSSGRGRTPPECGDGAPSPRRSVLQARPPDQAALTPWFPRGRLTAFSVAAFLIP